MKNMIFPFKRPAPPPVISAITGPSEDEPVGVHREDPQDIQFTYANRLPERISAMPVTSVLSSDIAFRGTITQEGGCVIEGRVQGDIHLTGDDSVLEVREGSTFKGTANAAEVVIAGYADAEIQARHVVIQDSAVTRGKVVYQSISMQGGDNDISLKRFQPQ